MANALQAMSVLMAGRRQSIDPQSDPDSDQDINDRLGFAPDSDDEANELRRVLSREVMDADRSLTPAPQVFTTLTSNYLESQATTPDRMIVNNPPPPPPLPNFVLRNQALQALEAPRPFIQLRDISETGQQVDLPLPNPRLRQQAPTITEEPSKESLNLTRDSNILPAHPTPSEIGREQKLSNVPRNTAQWMAANPPNWHNEGEPVPEGVKKSKPERESRTTRTRVRRRKSQPEPSHTTRTKESRSDSQKSSGSSKAASLTQPISPLAETPIETVVQPYIVGETEQYRRIETEINVPRIYTDPRLNVLNQICREYRTLRSISPKHSIWTFKRESHFARVHRCLLAMSQRANAPFVVNESSVASPALMLYLFQSTLVSKSLRIRDVKADLPYLKEGKVLTERRFEAIITGCSYLYDRLKTNKGIISSATAAL